MLDSGRFSHVLVAVLSFTNEIKWAIRKACFPIGIFKKSTLNIDQILYMSLKYLSSHMSIVDKVIDYGGSYHALLSSFI